MNPITFGSPLAPVRFGTQKRTDAEYEAMLQRIETRRGSRTTSYRLETDFPLKPQDAWELQIRLTYHPHGYGCENFSSEPASDGKYVTRWYHYNKC